VAQAQPPPPPKSTREALSEDDADLRIANAVRAELAVDPAVDVARIELDVSGGVVELRGLVPHLPMADAAVARAEMVHGVCAVVNRLEVPREGRPDFIVRTDVQDALRTDAVLQLAEPTVHVVDGVVTLRGVVDSFEERELATRIARSVRGVRDVVNRIVIAPATTRDDAEILEDVRRALRADRWVDEWLLEEEIDDGIVTIRGVQPTASAKRRVVSAAWVRGVRDVDASLVEVDPELAPERRRPPEGYVYPSDDEIRAAVRDALARDPRFRRNGIGVGVEGGVVRLRGSAPTLDARRAATEIAESIHGVWRVQNELTVSRARHGNDAETAILVDRALGRAAAIDEDAVDATVRDGVVTLTGTVETPHARTVAEDAVARVPGIRELENEITTPESSAGPIPNDVLLQNVIAHLHAHPYVDPSDVVVTVANGSVMLRGRVRDWRAKREAIRAAHEAGATNVLDDIEVEEGHRDPPE
jgi:osmotically-inducible protein OsmY